MEIRNKKIVYLYGLWLSCLLLFLVCLCMALTWGCLGLEAFHRVVFIWHGLVFRLSNVAQAGLLVGIAGVSYFLVKWGRAA